MTAYKDFDYKGAAAHWTAIDAKTRQMDGAALRARVEAYIKANDTCALATGSGADIRCTPIEYAYDDGHFYIFTEGGLKFRGLEENDNVALAIFDKFSGWSTLKGLQIFGKAEIIDPEDPRYDAAAAVKGIKLEALAQRKKILHLVDIAVESANFLDASLREEGEAVRQELRF